MCILLQVYSIQDVYCNDANMVYFLTTLLTDLQACIHSAMESPFSIY